MKRDWWQENIEYWKEDAIGRGYCKHIPKLVELDEVTCLACGKVLAKNRKEAEKYYA